VRGEFKLADPGLARFQKIQDGINSRGQIPGSFGGTTTYSQYLAPFPILAQNHVLIICLACPDRLSHKRNVDHAKSDMWSLGCVFSEAATWAVLGRTGVRQYTLLRQAALENSDFTRVKDSDCFHDGEKVLIEVTQWHKFLRQIKRPTDCISERILDMIDTQLFVGVENRADANKICQWWKNQGPSSPTTTTALSVPKTIQDALEHEIEQEALEVSKQFQSLGDENIETRRKAKSSNVFLQLPGMNTNRTTAYATTSRKLSQTGLIMPNLYHTESPDSQRQQSSTQDQDFEGGIHWSPRQSNSVLENNHVGPSGAPGRTVITVFDAYYEHQTSNAPQKGGLRWLKKRTAERKDKQLSDILVDRDLVRASQFEIMRIADEDSCFLLITARR
jgi:serine/threonine protein kinase